MYLNLLLNFDALQICSALASHSLPPKQGQKGERANLLQKLPMSKSVYASLF